MMKLFKYDQFIKESKEDIDSICLKYGIKNYTINSDGSIDVDGDVDLSRKNIDKLPLKFGKVTGHFDCYDNQLTSLEGCPREVGGHFYCSYNKLTSLEGSPNRVGGGFYCYENQLVDVKGFPLIIGGGIGIKGNPVEEIFKLFPKDRWVEVPEHLNEYNVIRDGRKVILQALEVVYDELVIEVPENIEIKGYEII